LSLDQLPAIFLTVIGRLRIWSVRLTRFDGMSYQSSFMSGDQGVAYPLRVKEREYGHPCGIWKSG